MSNTPWQPSSIPLAGVVWIVTLKGRPSMVCATEAGAERHRDFLLSIGAKPRHIDIQDWWVTGRRDAGPLE